MGTLTRAEGVPGETKKRSGPGSPRGHGARGLAPCGLASAGGVRFGRRSPAR